MSRRDVIDLGGIGGTAHQRDHEASAHVRVTVTAPDGTAATVRLSPRACRDLALQLVRLSHVADPEDHGE